MNFFVIMLSALLYGCAEHRQNEQAVQENLDPAATNLMASEKSSSNLVPAKRNPIQRARRRKNKRRARREGKRGRLNATPAVPDDIEVTAARDLGTSAYSDPELTTEESQEPTRTTDGPLASTEEMDYATPEQGTDGFESDVDEPPLGPTTPSPEGKRRSLDILMRSINEYLRGLHVNDGTVAPDWEELGDLNISEETLVSIVEEVREFQLSVEIGGPSCKLTQFLSLQKMGVSLHDVLRRLSGLMSDKKVCALTSRYRDTLTSLEGAKMNVISNELQERLNALYLSYEALVMQRMRLGDATLSLMHFNRGIGRVSRQMAREIRPNA